MANQTVSVGNSLLYLFDRPAEPIVYPKGDNDVRFIIPPEYLSKRNQSVSGELENRFGDDVKQLIQVKKIKIPDLSLPESLNRRDNFSLFIPLHLRMADRLIEVFLGMRDLEDLRAVACYARENCNLQLFVYAYSVALLHRPDTRNLPIRPLTEIFPDKFMGKDIVNRAREEANVVQQDVGARVPLEIPFDFTGTNLNEEHRVAYWREDLGISLHHWHWHLIYPFTGPDSVVRKDRRGEIFYYMHQQIIGRYNVERFCNNLGRVKRLMNLREPIKEGYFPKLDTLTSSRTWPPRTDDAVLSDVSREQDMQLKFDLVDIERWQNRIFEAIHNGRVVDEKGETIILNDTTGVDILGNMIEASPLLSPNINLYGNMHNQMHMAIALCHDPDGRHLETFNVIGDTAINMRDPAFYRLHSYVDDMFQEHKALLQPYTQDQLAYNGISVTAVEVVPKTGKKNEFTTFWRQDDINLSRGLDFSPRGPVFARVTHLDHTAFTYNIKVNNTGAQRMGTVRIFLAPEFDERGTPLLFVDQRLLFIELDKFTVNLKAGDNTITRTSEDSAVTIPYEQTFRRLQQTELANNPEELEKFNYCGCGWPQHMLLPKGTADGFRCKLFVMVSNYADDRVDQRLDTPECAQAVSYCGLRNKKYPDRRAMGFPFDRNSTTGATTLRLFVDRLPNMRTQDVTIRFTGQTLSPNQRG